MDFRWDYRQDYVTYDVDGNLIQTEKDAKRLFPKELWNDLHLQIIWYGRQYSPARGWDLQKDIITRTVGRASILKKHPQYPELFNK